MKDDSIRSRDDFLIFGAPLNRLWHRYRRTFVGNVAVVAGGTALAQIVSMVFLPLITRLYGPEVYGVLAMFLSIVGVLSSIVTLSYAFGIVLPKRDAAAYQLLKLAVSLTCLLSITTGLLVFFLKAPIVELFNLKNVAPLLWLIPIAVFLSGIIQSFEQWQVRNSRYKSLSAAVVGQSVFAGSARSGVGLLAPTADALVVLGIAAQAVQVSVLYVTARRSISSARMRSSTAIRKPLTAIRALARRYRDFPLYRAPQILLNTISRVAPIFILTSLFSPAVAGLYVLAQTVLYVPVSLIAQSVGKVFLQRIAAEAHAHKPLRPLILRATFGLTMVGIIPFGAIMLAGPWLFSFVFGADWFEAGIYARWLGVWVFFHFINIPAVQSLSLTNSQGILLVWEIVTTVTKIALLLLVGTLTKNSEMTVASYAVFGAIAYVVLIWIGIIRAGDNERIRQF